MGLLGEECLSLCEPGAICGSRFPSLGSNVCLQRCDAVVNTCSAGMACNTWDGHEGVCQPS